MSKSQRRGFAFGPLVVATVMSALSVSVAVPFAHAAIVDSGTETWTDSYSLTCEQGTKTKKDDFVEHITETGTLDYTVKVRGDGGFEYFTGSGSAFLTATVNEPDLGMQFSWTVERTWLDMDLKVLSMDGSLVTFTGSSVIHIVVFDPTGKVDATNNVKIKMTVVIDTSTGEVLSVDFQEPLGHIGAPGSCFSALDYATP